MISLRSLTLWSSAAVLVPAAAGQSFQYTDFTSTAGLQLVERAAAVGAVLRVHDETAPIGPDNRGAVWYQSPVAVVGGFDTTFVININQGGGFSTGGDGMAFVVQNEQLPGTNGGTGVDALGQHASALGYGIFPGATAGVSIDNSLVIEFDTYQNANQPAADPILDPDGNHISVHTGGSADNSQKESYSIGRAGSAVLAANLNDGVDHTVRVRYVPGTLEVFFDGAPVINVPYTFAGGGTYIDSGMPAAGLDLIGGSNAWVGFTGASGGLLENHDVISWSWSSGGAGSNYCTANANSTGAPAAISASGSLTVSMNDTTLICSDMPASAFAFFLTSQTQAFVMNPGGSQGNLCLGGSIGRYVGPGQIQNSGVAGSVSLAIDLTQHPTPTGLVQVMGGETWNFQTWFRDAVMGQATSNFSDGIEITFVN